MSEATLSDAQVSTIDAAIAKAKSADTTKTPATRKPRLTDDERAARKADRDAEKLAEKAEKKAAREAKRAEKEREKAEKGTPLPGTARLATAEAKLPELSMNAALVVAFANQKDLTETETVALIAHLKHALRTRQTVKAASGTDVKEGDRVRLVAGEERFLGQVGTVTKVSRIRCHVQLEGREKPVYVFTSDVAVLADAVVSEPAELTGTDG